MYYKNAGIYPVLEKIDDKFCKVMFEPDKEQVQQTPQQVQSPDDIEDGEEFIHKLKKLEDFGDFSKEVIKSLTAMFAQLQLCHENCQTGQTHGGAWQNTQDCTIYLHHKAQPQATSTVKHPPTSVLPH